MLTGTAGRLARTWSAGFLAGIAASVAVLGVMTQAAAAAGDPVPLPRLRPAQSVMTADPAAVLSEPDIPISQDSRFTREQQIALYNISRQFNSFRLMEGEFIQFGPGGEQSEGVFFLSKPGRIRFHYRPPVKLDIIADGSTVAIRDNRAETQDMYPLSQTPLRYLLSDGIDLTSDELVTSIREEPDLFSLLIVEQSKLVGGSLTLIFDRKSYEMRQWVVTDAQGLNTSVAIYNTATGRRQDKSMFRIDVSAFR